MPNTQQTHSKDSLAVQTGNMETHFKDKIVNITFKRGEVTLTNRTGLRTLKY